MTQPTRKFLAKNERQKRINIWNSFEDHIEIEPDSDGEKLPFNIILLTNWSKSVSPQLTLTRKQAEHLLSELKIRLNK